MATYWTVSIGQGKGPWYSCWPDKRITRGVFSTRAEACAWASRALGPGDWIAIERGRRLFSDAEIDVALRRITGLGAGTFRPVPQAPRHVLANLLREAVRGPTEGAVTPLIRMHSVEPFTLTATEYEQLQREVTGRILAQDGGISDEILLRLLQENAPRYHECKALEAAQRVPSDLPLDGEVVS